MLIVQLDPWAERPNFSVVPRALPPTGPDLSVPLPSVRAMDGQDWIDGYRGRLAAVRERADAVTDELAGITATASSRDGIASVGVDAAGGLRHVAFGGAAERRPVAELAAAVVEAGQRAQAQAARAAGDALARLTERSPQPPGRPPGYGTGR